MNVRYFLITRLKFIRQFYITASMPYLDRKRKIETEEEPFLPPYSEDGDPAFIEEWIEADESLHILAYSCVSMLAAALHLYLKTWVRESEIPTDEEKFKKIKQKQGWLSAYMEHFLRRFDINSKDAPINLRLLEEIVLTRNVVEHPPSIISLRPQLKDTDLRKLRPPFFVSERESALFANADESEIAWLIPPTLHVTQAQLFEAISEVDHFAEWFETKIEKALYDKRTS